MDDDDRPRLGVKGKSWISSADETPGERAQLHELHRRQMLEQRIRRRSRQHRVARSVSSLNRNEYASEVEAVSNRSSGSQPSSAASASPPNGCPADRDRTKPARPPRHRLRQLLVRILDPHERRIRNLQIEQMPKPATLARQFIDGSGPVSAFGKHEGDVTGS